MFAGSCLCADITWSISCDLNPITNCHCSMCHKSHGTAFSSNTTVPSDEFHWTCGYDRIHQYESSPGVYRPFCSRCGSKVPVEVIGDEEVKVPVGNLQGPIDTPIQHDLFVRRREPWLATSEGVPQFDSFPPSSCAAEIEQSERKSDMRGIVAGSCLCGVVTFEFDSPNDGRLVNCYCSRCRRTRSAAFASQLIVPPENFRWHSGKSVVRHYRLAEAKYFLNSFCIRCGSLAPYHHIGIDMIAVPIGALDQGYDFQPCMHVHVASKAPWVRVTDDVAPRFDAYPPGVRAD